MIKVTKDTIYLFDELNERYYFIYRNHITSILLEEYILFYNFSDLKSYQIAIHCDNGDKYFVLTNSLTVLGDVLKVPFSEINNSKDRDIYLSKLDEYVNQHGEDYLEKVIDSTSFDITDLFEEIVNGNEDFEYDNIRFMMSMNF